MCFFSLFAKDLPVNPWQIISKVAATTLSLTSLNIYSEFFTDFCFNELRNLSLSSLKKKNLIKITEY